MSKSIQALVSKGAQLKESIKTSTAELKEIEAVLIEAGLGDHEDGQGHKAMVIQPTASVSYPSDAEDQTKVRELAGEFFAKLFDKITTQKAVKAFKDIALAVLPKRDANKIIALCTVEKGPYVKWS